MTIANIFFILSTYIRVIVGTPYYHMWYMYMLIGLYMITPIIGRSINGVKLKQLFFISFFFIGVGVINNLVSKLIWPISFINYIGYYILGYCLKEYYSQDNRGKKYFCMYIFSSLMIFIITEVTIRYNLLNKTLYFYEYLSPFVILSSIGIFIYFLRHKDFKINVDRILPHTFNIYIIHAGIYSIISILINKLDGWKNPIWFIPFLGLIVFITSLGMSIIINKVVDSLKIKCDATRKNKLVVTK